MKKIIPSAGNMTHSNITTASSLLVWNSKNLTSSAQLNKQDLGRFFAPAFRVKANGKDIPANYDNYFDFLNTFRATIKTIEYELEEFIVDATHVVIPLKARITRNDNRLQTYDAILILGFDDTHKITLWQEVYIEI
jgi:hypothetical protein